MIVKVHLNGDFGRKNHLLPPGLELITCVFFLRQYWGDTFLTGTSYLIDHSVPICCQYLGSPCRVVVITTAVTPSNRILLGKLSRCAPSPITS